MSEEILVGRIYRHFKGENKLYKVLNVAYDCENPGKEVVVYEQLYPSSEYPQGTVWIRGLEDFLGFKEFSDGKKIKRFVLVE